MALTIRHKRILEKSKFLYHGTNRESINKIMKEGLKPGIYTNNINYPNLSDSNAVYLTSNKESAYWYARKPTVIIKVDVSKLDKRLLDCDSNDPGLGLDTYFRYFDVIEPKALTIVGN